MPEDDRVTGRDRESRLERGRSPGTGHFGRIVDRDGPGFGERSDKAVAVPAAVNVPETVPRALHSKATVGLLV